MIEGEGRECSGRGVIKPNRGKFFCFLSPAGLWIRGIELGNEWVGRGKWVTRNALRVGQERQGGRGMDGHKGREICKIQLKLKGCYALALKAHMVKIKPLHRLLIHLFTT